MRLAASALLISLSTGCLFEADPPAGDVDLYWSFHSDKLGDIGDVLTDDATAICTRAAVDDVVIWLWLADPPGAALEPSTVPCISSRDVPGTAFRDLEPGIWGYLLEARRGGVKVYEVRGDFVIRSGEATIEDARAPPVDGNWDVVVAYSTATAACAPGDRVKFDLLDVDAAPRVVFSTDDARVNPPVAVPCGDALHFTIPSVAPGQYQFTDWVHVDASGAAKAYGACRPSWTQPDYESVNLPLSGAPLDVTAIDPPLAGNPGICL